MPVFTEGKTSYKSFAEHLCANPLSPSFCGEATSTKTNSFQAAVKKNTQNL
jgi:hypothetical protein